MAQTIASSSRFVTLYCRSDLVSIRLANAITRPPCVRQPPTAVPLASTSRTNGGASSLNTGSARTGGELSDSFRRLNAACSSGHKRKGRCFSVSLVSGLDISAYPRMWRRKYPHKPRKTLTCLALVGTGHSCMSLTFSTSHCTPDALTLNPRKLTSLRHSCSFFRDTVKPDLFRADRTLSRLVCISSSVLAGTITSSKY